MAGLTLGTADTPLTERAAELLAAGPADPQTLIAHVCQLTSTTLVVAEHMASALFAGHQKFLRGVDGRWMLRELAPPPYVVAPPTEPLIREYSTDPLFGEAFAVVDVETTGSRVLAGDRVTEVAVVRVQHGVATRVFETLVNPERPIPASVTAITNITSAMVQDAPPFRDICAQLVGVLEGTVFVAHNADFDWRFLSHEIERAMRRPLTGRRLCTVKLSRRLVPGLRRRNLDALQQFYGVENHARHRAGGDATATAAIFLKLLDAARDRGLTTLEELDVAQSRGSSRKKRRRRPPALPHSASDDSSA